MNAVRELVFAKAEPKVDFLRTIPRHLTHKRRIENVLVTSLTRTAEQSFVCGAYVPQANLFLNEMKSHRNDVTLILTEIGRQVGMAVCHEYLGVDQATAFILNTMGLELLPALHEVDWSRDDALVVHVDVKETTFYEDGALRSIGASGEFLVNGVLVCRQFSDWVIHPKERYLRLREISRAKASRASSVTEPAVWGLRIDARPQVQRPVVGDSYWVGAGGESFTATLKVDQDNLFFFDHANDHVPGMLILEGMREVAVDMASRLPWAAGLLPKVDNIEVEYRSFAELDQPVSIVVHLNPSAAGRPVQLRVEARQAGKPVAAGIFTLS